MAAEGISAAIQRRITLSVSRKDDKAPRSKALTPALGLSSTTTRFLVGTPARSCSLSLRELTVSHIHPWVGFLAGTQPVSGFECATGFAGARRDSPLEGGATAGIPASRGVRGVLGLAENAVPRSSEHPPTPPEGGNCGARSRGVAYLAGPPEPTKGMTARASVSNCQLISVPEIPTDPRTP